MENHNTINLKLKSDAEILVILDELNFIKESLDCHDTEIAANINRSMNTLMWVFGLEKDIKIN